MKNHLSSWMMNLERKNEKKKKISHLGVSENSFAKKRHDG